MAKVPLFLRLVETKAPARKVEVADFAPSDWQRTLFTAISPHLLIFMNLNRLREEDFITTVSTSKARYAVDLRIAPRFDIGKLTRKVALAVLNTAGTKYYDVSGFLGIKSSTDAAFQPSSLALHLKENIFGGKGAINGPVIFFTEDIQWSEEFMSGLAEELESVDNVGWEILKLPYIVETPITRAGMQRPDNARNLIFISHANPDDNDFARWLGTQLTLAGYEIWSDITGLLGGEQFWDNIEEAIRDRAVKFVVALSKISQTRPGVLDEIAVAVATERAHSLRNFVIPVKIDDLPYSRVRANVARKNIIDFSANWALGLSMLLQALARDGVPRNKTPGAQQVSKWANQLRSSQTSVVERSEKLVSNWLLMADMPPQLYMLHLDAPTNLLNTQVDNSRTPYFRHHRLIGTFESAEGLQSRVPSDTLVSTEYEVEVESFLLGQCPNLPGIKAVDAHRYLASLMRQAWNQKAQTLGFRSYEMASGALAWFPPIGLIQSNRVIFTDPYGIRRRKNLIGFSAKRKVHWHFGLELKPALSRPYRFVLRPHVIFTEDGANAIESTSKMHVLRRSFCKSWWNDRWRDLTLAYLAFVRGPSLSIELEVGTGRVFVFESDLATFVSPISIDEQEDTATAFDDIIEDPDDTFDFDEFDQSLLVEDS